MVRMQAAALRTACAGLGSVRRESDVTNEDAGVMTGGVLSLHRAMVMGWLLEMRTRGHQRG